MGAAGYNAAMCRITRAPAPKSHSAFILEANINTFSARSLALNSQVCNKFVKLIFLHIKFTLKGINKWPHMNFPFNFLIKSGRFICRICVRECVLMCLWWPWNVNVCRTPSICCHALLPLLGGRGRCSNVPIYSVGRKFHSFDFVVSPFHRFPSAQPNAAFYTH